MEIRLDKIGDDPYPWRESRTISAESLQRRQLVGLSNVSWGGAVTPISSGFLFSAQLEYKQELSCPRCLKTSWTPVTADVELLLVAASEEPLEGELGLREEDLSVIFVEGEVLDTEPILLEQLQLNVPMRQLCRPDCAGLCPSCGADLNKAACECDSEQGDPRWADLAALRDKLAE